MIYFHKSFGSFRRKKMIKKNNGKSSFPIGILQLSTLEAESWRTAKTWKKMWKEEPDEHQ